VAGTWWARHIIKAAVWLTCGVECPGSGVQAASTGAQRGYSENTAWLSSVVGSLKSGSSDTPSTSGGTAKPACGKFRVV
jgi:hypothetical protein